MVMVPYSVLNAPYDGLKPLLSMLNLPLTLNISTVHLTDEQFYHLAIANPQLRMERTSKGDLILMTPVGGFGFG